MIIFVFVTQIELLMTDRIYYRELDEKRELDNLMNLAMIDVNAQMNLGIENKRYSLTFINGNANVSVYRQEEIESTEILPMYIYQVYISCIIKNGQIYSLVYKYDPSQDRIYNLVEAITE